MSCHAPWKSVFGGGAVSSTCVREGDPCSVLLVFFPAPLLSLMTTACPFETPAFGGCGCRVESRNCLDTSAFWHFPPGSLSSLRGEA